MAGSPRRRRRRRGGNSGGNGGSVRPLLMLDGLVVVVIALAAGIGFGFFPAVRMRAVETLGVAWVPVGLWLAATVIGLRYRPRFVVGHWRWWVTAASLTAIAVGILSFFHPGFGIWATYSLGGSWGQAVGGAPLALGVAKLVAIAVLTPVVLSPRRAGYKYAKGFELIGHGVSTVANRSNLEKTNRLLRRIAGRRPAGPAASPPEQAPVAPPAPAPAYRETSGQETTNVVRSPASDADAGPEDTSLEALVVERAALGGYATISATGEESTSPLPPAALLSEPEPFESSDDDLVEMGRLIEATLASHGVAVEVRDFEAGPRVVRFGLDPGWLGGENNQTEEETAESGGQRTRVRVQSILAREKDLALALKTPSLRFQATIPGESLVGLEVPVPKPRKVSLRQVVEDEAFGRIAAEGGLPIALGQDIRGSAEVLDLTSLPHLLIAGSTGTGKSVCLNSVVASLLLTKTPGQLRLLMVDPKGVELVGFDRIPHLLVPTIRDSRAFASALKGLLEVMRQRYEQLAQAGVRNISGYNAQAERQMPYLVVIVDELAELMMSGREIEEGLVRLAQMGRAIGIHLVLATQRPTVDVVTGHLKANIATRIAFTVASQTDSRVILDAVGAEDLLGRGDLLLLDSRSPLPRRAQGTLVEDAEIDRLVEFWVNPRPAPETEPEAES